MMDCIGRILYYNHKTGWKELGNAKVISKTGVEVVNTVSPHQKILLFLEYLNGMVYISVCIFTTSEKHKFFLLMQKTTKPPAFM
jgi:hypothetical protein